MTTQTLTPVQFVADGAGIDITAAMTTQGAFTATTLLFANTGREILFLVNASSTPTLTVDVGALVDGQPALEVRQVEGRRPVPAVGRTDRRDTGQVKQRLG